MSTSLPTVTITTDGSAYPNDGTGKGGWAAILRWGDGTVRALSGGASIATNNTMELMAILCALRYLSTPHKVLIRTDSQYAKNCVTVWLAGWKKKGWVTGSGDPVKNADLIRAIDTEAARHEVEYTWLRGHSGDLDNESCDILAAQARRDA